MIVSVQAMQALQDDYRTLQQEKEGLAEDLQDRHSALDTAQQGGKDARDQLAAVRQELNAARAAHDTATQVGRMLTRGVHGIVSESSHKVCMV